MANVKINDLPVAGAASSSMQLETDIGGTIPNKVTVQQLSDKILDVDLNLTTTLANAIQTTNATTDGLSESTITLTGPAANQFQLTRGTTDLLVQTDCTIDQNLSTTSDVAFNSIDMVNQIDEFSTDGTLADDSDLAVPTEKAVKTYIDNKSFGAVKDILTITSDGQTAFTLSVTPATDTFKLFRNGQLRTETTDYTLAGTSLTWLDPVNAVNPMGEKLLTTDNFVAYYGDETGGGGSSVWIDGGTNVQPINARDCNLATGQVYKINNVNIDAVSGTLTNKTIDIDNNTVSNIETDNFKTNVVDTDGTLTANSDTRLASQKAIKTYVDAGGPTGYWTRTGTTLEPTTSGDDLDMGSGPITTTGGIVGANLTMTSSNPELKFDDTDDDPYIIKTNGGDDLHFFNDVAGHNALYKFFTKSGDGTDLVGLQIFGKGTSISSSPNEILKIQYDSNIFSIFSSAGGGGTDRDIQISAVSASNQLLISTDGNVSTTGTFTADDGIVMPVDNTDVSNPPTDAQLDSAFGTPASVGAGWTTYLDDNGAGNDFYQIVSDGTNWWVSTLTKAV